MIRNKTISTSSVASKAALPWILCGLLLLVLPMIFTNGSSITILNKIGITIVFALSYNMLLGQAGLLSFGHAVYMGIGGFACVHFMNYIQDNSLPVPLPLLPLFGGLVGLGVATIIGSFVTRKAGTVFAMITLGVGELIAACSLIIVAFFGGEEGVKGDRTFGLPVFGVEFFQQIDVYNVIAGWVLLSALLMYLFSLTPVGRMANAVRDNPERVEFLGYSARWLRFYSFIAAGFFAGVAGGLFAINYEIMTENNLGVAQSGSILLITFLGGVGFFIGPVIGAIVFTLLQTVLGLYTELWQLYVGILFVTTVMFFPEGLAGLINMHCTVLRLGNARMVALPYLKTLFPAAIAVLACASFLEIIFHQRHGMVGEDAMTLFWITFDASGNLPVIVSLAVIAGALELTRRNAPALVDTWHRASTPARIGER